MSLTSRSAKTSRFASTSRKLTLEKCDVRQATVTFNLPSVKNIAQSPTGKMTPRNRSLKFFPEISPYEDIVGSEALKNMTFALNPQIYHRMKKKRKSTNRIIEILKSQAADVTLIDKNLVLLKRKKDSSHSRQSSISNLRPKLRQPRSVLGGTFSMMSNETRFPNLSLTPRNQDLSQGPKIDRSEKKNDALRKSVISWLLEHRKDDVDKINDNHQVIISWIAYLNSINKTEFDELMIAVGVKQNPNLYARLFWLFDMNGDGIIDQKELLTILEWFKENSFEERLKMFFELADDDDKGYLNEDKLFSLFKKNLRSDEELRKLKFAVKALIEKEIRPIDKHLIRLDDLTHACEKIEALKSIVESNVTFLKTTVKPAIKIGINNIMSKPPAGDSDGFSFPYMQKLMDVLEEKYEINREYTKLRNYQTQSMRQLKMNNGQKFLPTEEM